MPLGAPFPLHTYWVWIRHRGPVLFIAAYLEEPDVAVEVSGPAAALSTQ